MFLNNFKTFLKYYGKGRETRIFGFFLLSLIAGFFEFVGIAIIYPFILLILNPESIVHTKYYASFVSFVKIDDVLTNAFILGTLVVGLFIIKNLFMILIVYLQNKFTNNWKLDINKKFMKYYLFSPYKNSLKTSSSEKIYNLTSLTIQALDGFVFRAISLATNSIIVFMILSLLFIKFLWAALITTAFVLVSLAIQNKFFKKRTAEISKELFKTSILSNNKIIENIVNIKELKILSAEEYFYDEYLNSQKDLNQWNLKNNFYSSIPPYIIEILIVLSLLILAGIISAQNLQNSSGMIASYAVIVAAIFRIAPALNRIQTAVNLINGSRDFVKAMNDEYEKSDFDSVDNSPSLKIQFYECLKLKNVDFSYVENKPVIKDLNLEIKKGEFVGIIGLSGAGKSTLADIIMGLLPVDSGEVFVDSLLLSQNDFSALRKLIGYVPQQINILDDSFKSNVAWGTPEDKIDGYKVTDALKKAQLWEFVQGFEDGVNAKVIVGSNGLSQGQKQRLAIARALYRDPQILIFDEATSALDVETENEITQMLKGLKGSKTIIAIAHRLSTLKSCDRLIYLKDGSVVDVGSFSELSDRHADFKKLVTLSNLESA